MPRALKPARIAASALTAALAAALALLAVASIGALVSGDTGDMWGGGVVMLGLFYVALAAGAAVAAWRLWPRRQRPGAG